MEAAVPTLSSLANTKASAPNATRNAANARSGTLRRSVIMVRPALPSSRAPPARTRASSTRYGAWRGGVGGGGGKKTSQPPPPDEHRPGDVRRPPPPLRGGRVRGRADTASRLSVDLNAFGLDHRAPLVDRLADPG